MQSPFGKLFEYFNISRKRCYHPFCSITLSVLLLLSLVLVMNVFSQYAFYTTRNSSDHNQYIESKSWVDYTLSQAASKIAQNNTLIVCTVTEPFLPLFKNWLISVAKHKHQDKVLVIAEDYQTLFAVNKIWPGHAVLLFPPLPTSHFANNFGSKEFYKLTSRRPHYLLKILELGYNVLYNDVDMVWLSDPFPYMVGENDVYVTDDTTAEKPLNHSHVWPKDGKMNICSCMIYMRPTNGAKLLMKTWIEDIKFLPWSRRKYINDQPAFNTALRKTSTAIKLYLLPQKAFPSGGLYFWHQKWAKKNKGMMAIIHNNWVIGLKKKIQRFKDYSFWFVDEHVSDSLLEREGSI